MGCDAVGWAPKRGWLQDPGGGLAGQAHPFFSFPEVNSGGIQRRVVAGPWLLGKKRERRGGGLPVVMQVARGWMED